tara:strand:+ start:3540 stop:4529 length:990 start_codon:yes stop_codon:yes gene_type:complete
MKKIFITGGSGFIGSHLTERLLKRGHSVKVLVPYDIDTSLGWLKGIKNKKLSVIHGDICDENFILANSKNIDTIVHLAALISIPYSYSSPYSYIKTNIEGTYNVLEAVKKNKIKRLIHTSTSEVYGSAQYSPIDEKHPLNPQSPYAASKVSADCLSLSYYKSFNLPVSIIRPFNTFGPRQSSRAVISAVISQCLLNNKEIHVGNINTMRDFTFVSDTVEGYVKAIETKKKIEGEVINLGTGKTVKIKKIINIVCKILKINPKITIDKKRFRPTKSEVNLLISNNRKAKKLLNWKPEYSNQKGLENALRETILWFRKAENIKKYSKNYKV